LRVLKNLAVGRIFGPEREELQKAGENCDVWDNRM
jgi:hypothetical protein